MYSFIYTGKEREGVKEAVKINVLIFSDRKTETEREREREGLLLALNVLIHNLNRRPLPEL